MSIPANCASTPFACSITTRLDSSRSNCTRSEDACSTPSFTTIDGSGGRYCSTPTVATAASAWAILFSSCAHSPRVVR